jgi:hypothetical protein
MVIGPKIGALINDIPISNNLLMTQNSRPVYCKLSQLELVVKNGNVIFRIQNLLMKSMRRFSTVSAKLLGSIPLSMVTPQSKGCKDLKIQLAVIILVSAHVGPKITIIECSSVKLVSLPTVSNSPLPLSTIIRLLVAMQS